MKFKLPNRMIEATRLTREGRLSEATSLIQRILRGPSATSRSAAPASASASPSLSPGVIELVAEKAETLAPRAASASPHVQDATQTTSSGGSSSGSSSSASSFSGGRSFRSALASRTARRKASHAATDTAPAKSAAATSSPQFLDASFTNNAGTRAYKLYIPASYIGKPLPLVIMLHGCTQSAADFAAGTGMNAVGEAKRCFIAYPEQSISANPNRCWNWFNPRDQQRDAGEPSLIAGITREIMGKYAVDGTRVYVAGLSAGGSAAAIMSIAYPDLYAAVGVHSGLPAGSASDLGSALAAMSNPKDPSGLPHGAILHGRGRLVPTIVFHGDKDTTVHPRNGHHVIRQSRPKEFGDLHAVSHHGHVPEGHAYTRTDHHDTAGRTVLEMWTIHGAGHAWSGGKPEGSYTDPRGPDASAEMVRFFFEHPRSGK